MKVEELRIRSEVVMWDEEKMEICGSELLYIDFCASWYLSQK